MFSYSRAFVYMHLVYRVNNLRSSKNMALTNDEWAIL